MPSKLAFSIRKYHKWLSLIIGVQALLWLISGVYMVVFDLNFIHGDHLVQKIKVPLKAPGENQIPFSQIRLQYPQAHEIVLENWQGMPHYRIYEPQQAILVDATTGQLRSPIGEADAIAVAQYHYTGKGKIESVKLLTKPQDVPSEITGRPLPIWQIKFDDFGSTALYVSPASGALTVQRHTFWRIFDFVWMLHIMDYENREDINNNLFRVAAVLGLLMSVFGMWLLYFSFNKKKADLNQSTAAGIGN